MAYGKDHFHQSLLPMLERFCKDSDDEVRCTVAAGFHEIVQLRSQDEQHLLIAPFMELMCSGSSDVVQRLTSNLHRSLPQLYKGISAVGVKAPHLASRARMDKLLLSCNRLLRGTGAWRSHESYLNNVAIVRNFIPVGDLQASYQPMLQEEVLTAVS